MENKEKVLFILHMNKQENLYQEFMEIPLNQKIYYIKANLGIKLTLMREKML